MKNRKLLIVAFLLSSALVMGIGFAAVTGNLAVSGEAAFYGHDLLQSNVAMSLMFKSATPTNDTNADWCSVTIPELDDPNTPAHTAYMDVNFYDDGELSLFKAAADFTIQYGDKSDNAPLPTIELGTLRATLVPTTGTEWPANDVFSISVDWVSHNGTDISSKPDSETVELTDGDTVVVRVTVTFDKSKIPGGTSVAEAELSGVINVGIPYAQVVDPQAS